MSFQEHNTEVSNTLNTKNNSIQLKTINKILVVRFRQIGDAILSSSICNTLKKSFPNSQIDFVVYDFIAPLFYNHHSINNVISIDKETRDKPIKYISFVWNLVRKEKYDLIVDVMSTPKSEFFTFFSLNSKFRLGRHIYSPKYWNLKKRGFTYTHSVKDPAPCDKSKFFKGLELLTPLENLGYNIKYSNDFSLFMKDDELENFKTSMINAGIDFSKERIAFAINSRRGEKVYPKKFMIEVILKFVKRYPNKEIIFFYSPEEKIYVKNFHQELVDIDTSYDSNDSIKGFSKRIFSNIETGNIRELALLIKNCNFFIGNDGGPRHLAVALDVKSFGIFSPASVKYDWFLPGNPRHEAVDSLDFINENSILTHNYNSLSFDEKYALISPELLFEKIVTFIEN